jgi:hypothetical protein
MSAVRKLTTRKAEFPNLNVELVLVVTRQNIAEIPAFIDMSERYGVDSIPLTPRKDRKSYRISEIQWDALGAGEVSPEYEPWQYAGDPYGRSAPLYCPSPYTAFYVNGTDRRVIPCVYMHKVPAAMVEVCRSLHQGPLMPTCLKCPFHC